MQKFSHPAPDEIIDRQADYVHIADDSDIATRVWLLDNGEAYEERVSRRTTAVISSRILSGDDEAVWCYSDIVSEMMRNHG